MPQIIDTLSIPLADCAKFTVNNALLSVPSVPAVGANHRGQNPALNNVFRAGDSLTVLSGGICLKEAFNFYDDPLLITDAFPALIIIPVGKTSGDPYNNPNFSNGEQYVPMENYEMAFSCFMDCLQTYDTIVPTKFLDSEDFYLTIDHSAVNISMIGVPAAMNGLTFYIKPFLKIEHNYPLSI